MVQYGTLLHWPPWAENLTRWNHLMLVINSSSNIIIYVAKVSTPPPDKYPFLISGFQIPPCPVPDHDLQEGGGGQVQGEEEDLHHHDDYEHQPSYWR